MRKICVSMLALLVLALVAVGCSSSDDGGSTGTSGSPAAKGTDAEFDLRWADAAPPVLDSAKAFDTATIRNIALGLEPLVKLDQEGKVVPALAESVERKDPTTYVYTLREGVKFSDGTPLTVDDVIYSLERYKAKDSQNSADYENVESITADGNSIVVKLKEPNESWQFVPTYAGYILQKAHAEKVGTKKLGTPGNLPIGTAPWKFDSFKPDVGLELSPNPHYWGEKPRVQNISVKFVKDQPATALAVRSGEVDGTLNEPNVKVYENMPGVNLLKAAGPDLYFLSLNTIVEPFNDIHVRRAISHAVNREGFVKSVLNGAGQPTNSMVPPALLTSLAPKADVDEMLSSLPDYPYDIEAAKAEMAKSKYPNGFETTTPVLASLPEFTRFAQILKADLEKIGIKLNIRETTDSDWLEILYGPRDKLGLFINKFNATYPDANAFLTYALDPASAKVNGLNSANLKDPTIGKLLPQQRQESDGAKRLEQIGEILKISNDEAAYAPIASGDRMAAISDKLVMSDFSPWTALGQWPANIEQAAGES